MRWGVLRSGPAHLFQVPSLNPDGSHLVVQPQWVDWVRALLVHLARLMQGHKSRGPLLTHSVLLTYFDP